MSIESKYEFLKNIIDGDREGLIAQEGIKRMQNISLDLSMSTSNLISEYKLGRTLSILEEILIVRSWNEDKDIPKDKLDSYKELMLNRISKIEPEDLKKELIIYYNKIMAMTKEEAESALQQFKDLHNNDNDDVMNKKLKPSK